MALGALWIALREHHQFVNELRARACFKLTPTTLDADEDGVLRAEGTGGEVRVRIELENKGDKAAGETVLNVVFPAGEGFRWCGPNGEAEENGERSDSTHEVLPGADGRELPARYLSRARRRIGLRNTYAFYVAVRLTFPDEKELTLPLRIHAEADEIPEDVREYSIRHTIRVQRRVPNGEAGAA